MATVTSPIILDSTGQAIAAAIQALAGGGGASSESIAPIESTTTASQAYAVGDLLFYDNTLYKVTTAITSGGTIEISGATPNVVQTDVDTELKSKIKLSSTPGLVKNDGTIDSTSYISDVSDKADKVISATNGNLAKLDTNGNLADSGVASADVVTKSQTAGLIKNDGTIDETPKANASALDTWTPTSTVSNGVVTFTNLNDAYNYSKPFFQDGLYTVTEMTKSGSGSAMSLAFATNAPDGTTAKLRIVN